MSLFDKMDPPSLPYWYRRTGIFMLMQLLQIHACIYRNQTMSMERALLRIY